MMRRLTVLLAIAGLLAAEDGAASPGLTPEMQAAAEQALAEYQKRLPPLGLPQAPEDQRAVVAIDLLLREAQGFLEAEDLAPAGTHYLQIGQQLAALPKELRSEVPRRMADLRARYLQLGRDLLAGGYLDLAAEPETPDSSDASDASDPSAEEATLTADPAPPAAEAASADELPPGF